MFSWIICGNRLFLWSYLSPAASTQCIVLELPSKVSQNDGNDRNGWLLSVVNWDTTSTRTKKVVKHSNSAGIVLCNQKTRAVVYWPDVYSEGRTAPITSFASSDELEMTSSLVDGKTTPNRQRQRVRLGSTSIGLITLNSLIASVVPNSQHVCAAFACGSNGELWQFHCSPTGIHRKKVYDDILSL